MFTFEKTLPENVGISSKAIKNVLERLDKKDVPMHSLLIMKDDKLIFEKYYAPYTADTLHRLFIQAKHFVFDNGPISLDKLIVRSGADPVNSAAQDVLVVCLAVAFFVRLLICRHDDTFEE